MLAHYPTGARYVRHSDVSPAMSHRRLSAILYLNADWNEEHGGQLVLFTPSGSATAVETATAMETATAAEMPAETETAAETETVATPGFKQCRAPLPTRPGQVWPITGYM